MLAENKPFADEKLAVAIKDICYAAWAETPTRARQAADALRSLHKFDPGEEIQAFFYWVSGISDITCGKLESAIDNLDKAASVFLGLDREPDSAQTGMAKLIALGLLGRYDEAVETGTRALKIFEKYGDEVAAAKIETNLGNIVSRQELHLQAEKYCLSARKRFVKTGEKNWQIMAENCLAITYTQLNDFPKAERFFAHALKIARESGMLLTEAELEASIGNLALFRGRYDEALKFLELSRRKYEMLDMPHQRAVAALEIADIYRELNLTHEALEIYSDVAETFKRLKLQGEEARTRANFGRAAAAAGDAGPARRELKKSAYLYERERNKTGAAAVKLAQARIEIDQNRPVKALGIILESEKLLGESDSLRHKLGLKLLKAEALDRTGETRAAEELLTFVLSEAGRREQPNVSLAALNLLGKMARTRSDTTAAKRYFKKAVTLIETLRAPLAGEEFRMAFLANKLEPFENLSAIYIAENKLMEAFLHNERARSRVLAEIVSSSNAGSNGAVIPREFSERLTRLREELNWYYSHLRRAGDDEIGKLQEEVQKREKEIAAVMRQIESTRGDNVRPTLRSFDPAQNALK